MPIRNAFLISLFAIIVIAGCDLLSDDSTREELTISLSRVGAESGELERLGSQSIREVESIPDNFAYAESFFLAGFDPSAIGIAVPDSNVVFWYLMESGSAQIVASGVHGGMDNLPFIEESGGGSSDFHGTFHAFTLSGIGRVPTSLPPNFKLAGKFFRKSILFDPRKFRLEGPPNAKFDHEDLEKFESLSAGDYLQIRIDVPSHLRKQESRIFSVIALPIEAVANPRMYGYVDGPAPRGNTPADTVWIGGELASSFDYAGEASWQRQIQIKARPAWLEHYLVVVE